MRARNDERAKNLMSEFEKRMFRIVYSRFWKDWASSCIEPRAGYHRNLFMAKLGKIMLYIGNPGEDNEDEELLHKMRPIHGVEEREVVWAKVEGQKKRGNVCARTRLCDFSLRVFNDNASKRFI